MTVNLVRNATITIIKDAVRVRGAAKITATRVKIGAVIRAVRRDATKIMAIKVLTKDVVTTRAITAATKAVIPVVKATGAAVRDKVLAAANGIFRVATKVRTGVAAKAVADRIGAVVRDKAPAVKATGVAVRDKAPVVKATGAVVRVKALAATKARVRAAAKIRVGVAVMAAIRATNRANIMDVGHRATSAPMTA